MDFCEPSQARRLEFQVKLFEFSTCIFIHGERERERERVHDEPQKLEAGGSNLRGMLPYLPSSIMCGAHVPTGNTKTWHLVYASPLDYYIVDGSTLPIRVLHVLAAYAPMYIVAIRVFFFLLLLLFPELLMGHGLVGFQFQSFGR